MGIVELTLRPTTYPRDIALSVEPGTMGYRGWATAGRKKGSGDDVILMAHSLPELNQAFFELTGQYPIRSACYEVVLMRRAEVALDEEI